MKNLVQLAMIFGTLFMFHQAWAAPAATIKTSQLSEVFKAPGSYSSPAAKCPISLTISDQGGFTQLVLRSRSGRNKTVSDVTGVIYISGDRLVYTTSPIYGMPGVFLYNCLSKNIKRIVGPKKIDKAYPRGSDYFELHDVEGQKIYFYYAPDVDQIDFSHFRTKEFLFEVLINGASFEKASVR